MENTLLLSPPPVPLELSAIRDLVSFGSEVEGKGLDVDEASCSYGRRIGSRKKGSEERTPLIIAAMFGSTDVLKYVIEIGKANVNRACGSDMVTALRYAVAGGSNSSVAIVKTLLDADADSHCLDANENKPEDLFALSMKCPCNSRKKLIESLLKGKSLSEDEEDKPIALPQLITAKILPPPISSRSDDTTILLLLRDRRLGVGTQGNRRIKGRNRGILGQKMKGKYCFKVLQWSLEI